MAITWKNRWYGNAGVAVTADAGDYIVASVVHLVAVAGSDTITPPAGFTQVATRTWTASGSAYKARHSIFQKLVASGSEGTLTFTTAGSLVLEIFISSWTGVDTTTGIEANASTGVPGDAVTPIATSQNFASVTSATNNAVIVAQGFAADSSGGVTGSKWPLTGPTGYTAITATNYVAQFYKLEPTAGATGSLAVTLDTDVVAWSAWTLALKPGATQTLTPSLFTNTNTFYSPTVTRGTVTLTPGLFTNSNTFYAPTVTPGTVSLTPSLFTNTSTFYSPTVSQGGSTQTLTPSLFTNSNTFYGPTISVGAVTLSPSLFTNSSTFYSTTVTPGPRTLTPGLLTNTNSFYAPTVTRGTTTLAPALFTNASVFYAPTVTTGAVTLTPALFTNAPVFYPPTVYVPGGTQTLLPSLFTNLSVFYPAAVNQNDPPGTYPLSIEGGGSVVQGALQGGGSVVAGSIPSNGRVVAGYLRGRP